MMMVVTTVIVKQTTTILQKHYLTLYQKCRLAYNYEKLVVAANNKASLCRTIGIDWSSYYYTKYILETNYDNGQGGHHYRYHYKDKLEELKDKLGSSDNDSGARTDEKRIKYAYDKVKRWNKEIEQIERIPSVIRFCRDTGHSNMYIEKTIEKKISLLSTEKLFGPFCLLLPPCKCCGSSKLCICEPYQYVGRPRPLDWYRELEDKEITEWLNGNEHSREEFFDAVNTYRLKAMMRKDFCFVRLKEDC
jgi:hypothetical protein